jgi:hypothetical protein
VSTEALIVIGIEAVAIIFLAGASYSSLRHTIQITNHLDHRMKALDKKLGIYAERLATIEGMTKIILNRK